MNKTELKKILKPLIKECIKEVIREDGTLSAIVSEVMKETAGQSVVYETKKVPRLETDNEFASRRQRKQKHLQERKKKMLDVIGREAYNGVNLFEGTSPMKPSTSATSHPGGSALEGVAPGDSGVDISSFTSSNIWKKLAGN
tara:strand:+ start:523 stop:948 length:426 start_codon:yes stop_codon:yes gene_type:complete